MTLIASLAGSLKRQYASQAAGFAAVTIATAALIGWWVGLPMLSSWGSQFATEKPTTALDAPVLSELVETPRSQDRTFRPAMAFATCLSALPRERFSSMTPSRKPIVRRGIRERCCNPDHPIFAGGGISTNWPRRCGAPARVLECSPPSGGTQHSRKASGAPREAQATFDSHLVGVSVVPSQASECGVTVNAFFNGVDIGAKRLGDLALCIPTRNVPTNRQA